MRDVQETCVPIHAVIPTEYGNEPGVIHGELYIPIFAGLYLGQSGERQ